MVVEEGRALVIGVNKWDSCRDREARLAAIRDRLERSLPQTRGLPVVPPSPLPGHNIEAPMDSAPGACEVWRRLFGSASERVRVCHSVSVSQVAGTIQNTYYKNIPILHLI